MLLSRAFSVCSLTASSASSSGRPALTSVASWRVSSARSSPEMPLPNSENWRWRLAFARLDLGDLDRQQLPVAQELADVPRRVAFETPAVLLAAARRRATY